MGLELDLRVQEVQCGVHAVLAIGDPHALDGLEIVTHPGSDTRTGGELASARFCQGHGAPGRPRTGAARPADRARSQRRRGRRRRGGGARPRRCRSCRAAAGGALGALPEGDDAGRRARPAGAVAGRRLGGRGDGERRGHRVRGAPRANRADRRRLRLRGRAAARDRAHPGAARPAGGRGVAAVRRAPAGRLARERGGAAAVAVGAAAHHPPLPPSGLLAAGAGGERHDAGRGGRAAGGGRGRPGVGARSAAARDRGRRRP